MGKEQTIKVLVVDDEEHIRRILVRVLNQEGYQTAAASNGDDALFQLAQSDFDLVMLDIRMPGLNGLETLSQIKRDHPEVRVIMLTGMMDDTHAEAAMKRGANAYLTKPCDLSTMLETVRKVIGPPSPENNQESVQEQSERDEKGVPLNDVQDIFNSGSVLVVDDEDHIRKNISRALSGEGYDVDDAANGHEALRKLAEEEFDVVLLDIRMPGMSGLEVLRKLPDISPNTVPIMLTGMADKETVQAALAGKIFAYLIKPCNLQRLIDTVGEAIKRRTPSGSMGIEVKYSRGKNVLVVDDETHVRENLVRCLELEDYDAIGADSGPDALFKLSQERFSVVILDIKMPEMNGIEVLRQIKTRHPDTFVIMLTGLEDRDSTTQAEAIAEGALAYLQKPVRLETLIQTVEEAFRQEAAYWQSVSATVHRSEDVPEDAIWRGTYEPRPLEIAPRRRKRATT